MLPDIQSQYQIDCCQNCRNREFRMTQDKNNEPHCIQNLGMEIDTKAMEVHLQREMHQIAMAVFDTIFKYYSVILRHLKISVGFKLFAPKVVPASHSGSNWLYDTVTSIPYNDQISTESEILTGLKYSQMLLLPWNRTQLLSYLGVILPLWTDASGEKCIRYLVFRPGETLSSISTSAQLFCTTGPPQHNAKHNNFQQLYAVLHILFTWTPKSTACCINLHCNYKAVMAALIKEQIKGQTIISFQPIAMHLALDIITLQCMWVQTQENALAKVLSWWKVSKITNLCTNLKYKQTQLQIMCQTPVLKTTTFSPRL